ncbi:hypothetical protein PPSIR1_12808 [Plesiocystis pacifica SIR-1]|uniref:Lipoprotein n=1 Tax=Plesiocystis pacifica SIR-1 TaxID=391625 RepID=A6G066_9BACT|nr:hypothetical protein [Plesiocystis pacifica]EDM80763.1 hypothetical protein PPSIR1_12808 [Plesiocystis pacifica SIR-1]
MARPFIAETLGAALAVLGGCIGTSEPPPAPAEPTPAPEPEPDPSPNPPESEPPATWPAAVPTPEGFTLEGEASGALDPVTFMLHRPFAETWASWRPRLEEAGVALEAVDESGGAITASLCLDPCAEGDRHALWLSAYGEQATRGALIPSLARAPVELPGDCTPIDTRAFSIIEHRSGHGYNDYSERRVDVEQDYRWSFGPRPELDLDRDGFFDLMVPTRADASTCPTEVQWDLWVTRGACGHFVGHIQGDPANLWRPPPVRMVGGLVALPTREDPRGPHEGALDFVYEFDGARYQQVQHEEKEARCDVHPADCEPMIHSRCRDEAPAP